MCETRRIKKTYIQAKKPCKHAKETLGRAMNTRHHSIPDTTIYETRDTTIRDTTHAYVRHDSFICETRLIQRGLFGYETPLHETQLHETPLYETQLMHV